MNAELLRQNLIEDTRRAMNQAKKLMNFDLNSLTLKQNKTSWSILECLEHLNLYGDFYLPQIENKIQNSNTKPENECRSGLLGIFFAKSMLPNERLNKMKTFKSKKPLNRQLNKTVIDKFINQQIKLLELINQSRNVSLNKVKTQSSISILIKLKLGDTFQFLINHNIGVHQKVWGNKMLFLKNTFKIAFELNNFLIKYRINILPDTF